MRLTVGRKLGIGFTTVVILIALMAFGTIWSSASVADAQEDAARTKNTSAELTARVTDHVDWMNALKTTFLDNEERITVQVDHTLCGLGKWIYSDEAQALAERDPVAGELLAELEGPHHELHASAHEIEEFWTPRHDGLIEKLMEIRDSHRLWAENVSTAILTKAPGVDVQTDPNKCALGKFMNSDEYKQWTVAFPELDAILKPILEPHRCLHKSAEDINNALALGDVEGAQKVYEEVSLPCLAQVAGALTEAVELEHNVMAAQSEARRILDEKAMPALEATRSKLEELRDHLAQRADNERAAAAATLATSRNLNVGVALVAAVLAIGAGVVITRSIVGPIRTLMERFERIKAKDLTVRVETKAKDEVGDLSRGFNTLVETLQGVLKEVRDATEQVAGASTEIAASSEEISQGMQEQSQQTEQVSTAVEEMSQSVTEVARKGADAAETARDAGSQAETGGKVVEQTVAGMNEIADAVGRAAATVRELGSRAEQIGAVIEVINDIADQTNLLALNAAIEAARAGEHGRGFAVVADEVRKLADRTMKATEEISNSIEAIQSDTKGAVEQMDAGSTSVEHGVGLANQAGDSLRTIVAGSQQVLEVIEQIASATEEQAAASEEISHSVDGIRSVAQQANQGVDQAAHAAADLSRKAEDLQELVRGFKL